MQTQTSVNSFEWQWTKRKVFDSMKTFYRRLFHDCRIFADQLNDKIVAYVGSGGGRHVYFLSKFTKAKKIISVELAQGSIEYQKSYIKDERVEFIQGDAAKADFKCDFLYIVGVIQHTKNPAETLRKCFENLNDGGQIVVSFYCKTFATQILEPLRFILKRVPRNILWHLTWFLAPIFMARKSGREHGYKNARHTAYDWFGSHSYQYYFTTNTIYETFNEAGFLLEHVIKLDKGLFTAKKLPPLNLDAEVLEFGS